MAGCSKLPDELLDMIVEQFALKNWRKLYASYLSDSSSAESSRDFKLKKFKNMMNARVSTLRSLCLTSKKLNIIATPHLYRHPRTRPVVRAMLRTIKEKFQKFGDFQINEPNEPCSDVLIALCPNVRRLDIDLYYPPSHNFRFCEPGSLARLRNIHIGYCHPGVAFDLLAIKQLLRAAPNIETMDLSSLHQGCRQRNEIAIDFNNLKGLSLDPAVFKSQALGDFLNALPQPRSSALHIRRCIHVLLQPY
ncbi:hypothetical protein QBC35DRAFT_463110 [Podospora australis]|uniref:F-box domain-containing protein n=1 Tax=Podospora australis TaxID=1536484 RepID=A0AAN6WX92_9PEZI|nr:hypothetical protein QBC35DRAFT_463110 [Podospora australis]